MKAKESDWMPVFVLVERRRGVQAAHPDHKGPLSATYAEDVLQRVGTARRDRDDTYVISLNSLPLNGQLLMRPPKPGETSDAARKEVG